MAIIDVNKLVFERNEKQELIPITLFIKELGGEISFTPMPRGEVLERIQKAKGGETSYDDDVDVIRYHLKLPNLKEEDLKSLKLKESRIIAKIIWQVSTGSNVVLDEKDLPEEWDEIKKIDNDKKKDDLISSSMTEDTTT